MKGLDNSCWCVLKSRWINELSSLFEAVVMLSDTVFYAGDFNADLLHPDKPLRRVGYF